MQLGERSNLLTQADLLKNPKICLSWVFLSIWMKKRRLPFKLGPGYIGATGVNGHQRRDRRASGRPEIFLFHELNVLASILDVDIELQFG